jgi:probable rRNA maturation factor
MALTRPHNIEPHEPHRAHQEDTQTSRQARSKEGRQSRHKELLPRTLVSRWIKASLESDAELAVRLVGAEEGQALNRDYRQKDYATNVLTFDYAHEPVVMADLIICAPVIEQEAKEQNKDLVAHYAHMLVHGTLHAQGWDHEDPQEAEAMEAREREILAGLGFDDPYAL